MPHEDAFAVATLNVHGRAPRWRSRRVHLVRQLVALDADAIALQELRTWPSQGRWLRAALNRVSEGTPYSFFGARKRGVRGYESVGMLTRLPVLDRSVVPLGHGGRIAVRCTLDARGRAFDFYSVHFHHGSAAADIRLAAAERLLAAINARELPTVVAGDLNGTPDSREVGLLTQHLRSAHAAVHSREPQSTVVPVSRGIVLDYILVSEGIEVLDARVAFDQEDASGETVSDHLGLVASLRFGSMGL